jgi:hypothetical protein
MSRKGGETWGTPVRLVTKLRDMGHPPFRLVTKLRDLGNAAEARIRGYPTTHVPPASMAFAWNSE